MPEIGTIRVHTSTKGARQCGTNEWQGGTSYRNYKKVGIINEGEINSHTDRIGWKKKAKAHAVR